DPGRVDAPPGTIGPAAGAAARSLAKTAAVPFADPRALARSTASAGPGAMAVGPRLLRSLPWNAGAILRIVRHLGDRGDHRRRRIRLRRFDDLLDRGRIDRRGVGHVDRGAERAGFFS